MPEVIIRREQQHLAAIEHDDAILCSVNKAHLPIEALLFDFPEFCCENVF